jgi:hypothetical protein
MTTIALPLAATQSRVITALAAGAMLGAIYTLSPLTVLSLAVLAAAVIRASRGLLETEQRWFWSLLSIAILIRLLAIAGLFLSADDTRPFASFFGDEDLYKSRTVWMRNVGQGIPMSPADVIYSFDTVGRTSYIFVLAFIQALVGDAPYGLHVMNMVLYLCAALALYRVARRSYGPVVAMAGLIVLLFLPSLLFWSISVLKEPMNVFMIAAQLMCALAIVRAPRWWQKAAAMGGVVAFGLAMESLRSGGLVTAVAGTIGGLLLLFVLAKGRRLVAAAVAIPVAIALVASSPAVQERVLFNLRAAAVYHSGHVMTPGYAYRLLDSGWYARRFEIREHLTQQEAARFAVKALASYFTEPLPWRTESTALLAYVPEQMFWYLMALMLPFGVIAGMRHDRVMTSLLMAHALVAIALVALTSGNIGTLIRHRSLALPYLVWLSALGAHQCVRLYLDRNRVRVERSRMDGDR